MTEIFKVNIFLMIFGYSRIKYLCLIKNRNQDTLFSYMINAFRYFEGIPDQILFDNMKTIIDRSK
jgi:transposase